MNVVRTLMMAITSLVVLLSLPNSVSGSALSVDSVQTEAMCNRWVADTECGFMFTWPERSDLPQLGALVFTPQHTTTFAPRMQPEALKISHGRVTLFSSHDQYAYAWFPWNEFVAFNEAEIRAGRDPLLITADGQPVQAFHGDINGPRQAVNVGDDRFIDFWINDYVRQRLLANPDTGQPYPYENLWIGVDNAIFRQSLFTPATGWDAPFPQTDEEYVESVRYFFRRVKELAPDIHIIANSGSLTDENMFPLVYADIDGLMAERFPHADLDDPYRKADSITVLRRLIWFAEQDRVTLIKTMIPMDSQVEEHVRNAYIAYLIVRGENSFFGPHAGETPTALPHSYYMDVELALGSYIGPPEELQPNVWVRMHEGGIAYLNWSDDSVTFTVPDGYVDSSGVPIEQFTVPANSGDYVTVLRAHDLP